MLSKQSQESSPTPQFKSINSLVLSFLYSPTLISIYDYWKNLSFDETDLFGKLMPLFFNILSRLVIAFLPKSKHLLISWQQLPSAVILEPPKIKSWMHGVWMHACTDVRVGLYIKKAEYRIDVLNCGVGEDS